MRNHAKSKIYDASASGFVCKVVVAQTRAEGLAALVASEGQAWVSHVQSVGCDDGVYYIVAQDSPACDVVLGIANLPTEDRTSDALYDLVGVDYDWHWQWGPEFAAGKPTDDHWNDPVL